MALRAAFLLLLLFFFQGGNLSGQPLRVVCTTSFLADISAQVLGEEGQAKSILPVGTDPHIYDPVPEDSRTIAEADLLVKNGLTLEGWLEEMMANSGRTVPTVTATDGITPIQSAEHANAYDPHAWMNPLLVIQYAANIRDGLISVRPSRAALFEANFQEYKSQLEAMDA